MRATWRLGLLALLVAASASCGVMSQGAPQPSASSNVTGEIAALRDAPASAYADVAAFSLTDASIVSAAVAKDARYALMVRPGAYVLVSSTVDASKRTTTRANAVVEPKDSSALNVPLLIAPFGRPAAAPISTQAGGSVIGLPPISINGPPGLWLPDDASFPFATGFVDPCLQRGGRIVTLDPKILELIRNEQRLRASGRADGPGQFNPLTPTANIEGSVTVAPDGTSTVDLAIVDAGTGAELARIHRVGRPIEGRDIASFLRDIGRILAAEWCPPPTPATAATAKLTVRVNGDSSVEYTALSRKYYCGGGSRRSQPQQCELEVPRGSEVDFQRTLSLTTEEEARWRLASWGGCARTTIGSDPRGGHCKLTMDRDRTIDVTFERRVMLRVTHQLAAPPPLGFQWSLSADPQKGSGNPLASMGGAQQNCNLPARPVALSGPANDYKVTDPCDFYAMYDAGTTVTIDIGARGAVKVATFQGWTSGPCSGSDQSFCQFKIQSDTTVTTSFQQR